ncbi:MAG: V-type ATPase 116kDa subunit family protein, partial [Clostridia bacterium]|nr:V-type ATPase 116kDa subunit family protein [Clostridia bacterium]
HEKGFGKFSKGFGAVYGLINIMSDILSYARLFGLMLSGMIIAQTFNYKLGLPMIQGGGIGIPLGVIIIIIGHVFNLAMNVLGAYIHDSRLQYIEFFGKFYTGEGEKFTPFGSQFDYIYLTK